jgi:hypothetical protein
VSKRNFKFILDLEGRWTIEVTHAPTGLVPAIRMCGSRNRFYGMDKGN